MRARWTMAVSASTVLAAFAAAAPRPAPDEQPTMRPRLDDLRITPVAPPAANCGDVVPQISLGWAPPPPGALPGSTVTHYFTPGTLHIQGVAIVKNAGTQPTGGTEAFQSVAVTQRLTGFAGETELLRSRFRPLAAGAGQRFAFTMRVPFDTSTYRPYTPGSMTVTLTVALSFDKRAPVTLRPADCVMTNNVLVQDLRIW